jgi:hypothetical protein
MEKNYVTFPYGTISAKAMIPGKKDKNRGGKIMKRKIIFSLAILTILALIGANSTIAEDGLTTAYVVHGINGDDFVDLELDTNLPVDVYVNGTTDLGCAIPGFEFGDRVGPIELPAGGYDITISLAGEGDPCSGAAVIELTGVELAGGANQTIIAHRTADGSTGNGDLLGLGITASLFDNDFSATGRGKARILAHHTAKAPTVDVVITRDYDSPRAPNVTVPGFTNPTAGGEVLSQIKEEFRPGEWDVALEVDGGTAFGPDLLKLKPYTATYVYAVGNFGEPFTFQYLIYTEKGLKGSRR